MAADLGERMARVETKLDSVEKSITEIKGDVKSLAHGLDQLREKLVPLTVGMAELKLMIAANTAAIVSARAFVLRLLAVVSAAVIGLVVRAAWEWWA